MSNDGITKIIDFGFGKRIAKDEGFNKSITLNWWCDLPDEFSDEKYDYSTEVYFVGKLFEKIILDTGIEHFAYKNLLNKMCVRKPSLRMATFASVKQAILAGQFDDAPFSYEEKEAYRCFAQDLSMAISKIESGAKYVNVAADIERKLEVAYRSVMLEERVPNNSVLIRCFVNGSYYFTHRHSDVENLRKFLQLLKSCSREKKDIIVSNIFNRLDAISRYDESKEFDDADIPF